MALLSYGFFFSRSLFDDTYNTIKSPSEGLYKEKGSKFLAFAYPVRTVDEVKAHLDVLRKDYYDARHHCYAYILGANKEAWRANDDGEPSGTGGRPIYGQLLSADLTNTLIVVVRYFGGILLGASGLANAYKAAARDAIEHADIVEKTIDVRYGLHFEYALLNDVMRILKEYGLSPLNQHFDLDCSLEVEVRQSVSVRFYDSVALIRGVKIDIVS
ncbi:MAG: YigZ family protein [Bacteroidales bacterium]|nr:YigZ family protein [Bacteroidales bacterium]